MGRIGGALLAHNLLRNGTDLAFDNRLLYLNVTNNFIGINTQGPSSDLTIGTQLNNGGTGTSSIQTVNLVATNTTIGNFTIGTNTIQQLTSGITIQPNQTSNPTIVTPGLSTANLYFSGNTLRNTVTNDSINFTPNGTGNIILSNSGTVQVTVNASLHATGNITFDGNVTLGDQSTDTITFAAEVNSNLLPSTTASYNLGSSSLLWRTVYTNNFTASTGQTAPITASTANIGNFSLTGNSIGNSTGDVTFTPTGTGQVKFNNWRYINANTIVSPTSGSFDINSSANGYVKFKGTNGLVIPVGTTSGPTDGRPASPVQGMTRWNSTLNYVEIYNGTVWLPAYGNNSNATTQDVNDYSTLYSIVFGY